MWVVKKRCIVRAVLFSKNVSNKYWCYYTLFNVFNWENQVKSIQTRQALSTTSNTSETSSFGKYPSIFNCFASLFISGALLLNQIIPFKVMSNREIALFSPQASQVNCKVFSIGHFREGKSHEKLNLERNNLWFHNVISLYTHDTTITDLLISLRTLVSSIVRVLCNCCPSPVPLVL